NALLPLIDDVDAAQAALDVYMPEFEAELDRLLHAKLGLTTRQEGDRALFDGLFSIMQASHVDFTLLFRRLGDLQVAPPGDLAAADAPLRDLFIDRDAFDAWAVGYRERLRQEGSRDEVRRAAMNRVNPIYILRNYLAQ
ncbi:YdiU family protein, partial [Acinetobacter baumannii]|uniref:protein adenylyltransferase SelO family protein n=1 Tax=Acinetobacter baumannii TaxID=470 RepID=UPI001899F89A